MAGVALGIAKHAQQDSPSTAIQSAIQCIVDELALRKSTLGPAAAAFGRSADYLKEAVALVPGIENLDQALADHPSVGGRFSAPDLPHGLNSVFCSVEGCDGRPTHGHSPGPAWARSMPIPEFCYQHAPPTSFRFVLKK